MQFNFIHIDNNPLKCSGTFKKDDTELFIDFDEAFNTRRFETYIREKKKIGDIGFYGDEKSASYFGPFMVKRIEGSYVHLKKA